MKRLLSYRAVKGSATCFDAPPSIVKGFAINTVRSVKGTALARPKGQGSLKSPKEKLQVNMQYPHYNHLIINKDLAQTQLATNKSSAKRSPLRMRQPIFSRTKMSNPPAKSNPSGLTQHENSGDDQLHWVAINQNYVKSPKGGGRKKHDSSDEQPPSRRRLSNAESSNVLQDTRLAAEGDGRKAESHVHLIYSHSSALNELAKRAEPANHAAEDKEPRRERDEEELLLEAADLVNIEPINTGEYLQQYDQLIEEEKK